MRMASCIKNYAKMNAEMQIPAFRSRLDALVAVVLAPQRIAKETNEKGLVQDETLSERNGLARKFHEFPAILFAIDAFDERLGDVVVFDGEFFDDARRFDFEANVELADVHRAIFGFTSMAFLNRTRDGAEPDFEMVLHRIGFGF